LSVQAASLLVRRCDCQNPPLHLSRAFHRGLAEIRGCRHRAGFRAARLFAPNYPLAQRAFVRHSIDMTDSAEAAPTLAAGGIVTREGSKPRFAVVRLRRDKSWVLPKGKLNPGERALAAARREVLEGTGYRVSVHGFLGLMLYSVIC
jgi:NUDIX domain